jgi:hypothetical protein
MLNMLLDRLQERRIDRYMVRVLFPGLASTDRRT